MSYPFRDYLQHFWVSTYNVHSVTAPWEGCTIWLNRPTNITHIYKAVLDDEVWHCDNSLLFINTLSMYIPVLQIVYAFARDYDLK